MKILVDAYDSTTNMVVRREVLAAFSLRDDVRSMWGRESSPFWRYQRKRGFFENPHSEIRWFMEADKDVEALWKAVRERVLQGKDAEVAKEIVRARRAAEAKRRSSDVEHWRVPK